MCIDLSSLLSWLEPNDLMLFVPLRSKIDIVERFFHCTHRISYLDGWLSCIYKVYDIVESLLRGGRIIEHGIRPVEGILACLWVQRLPKEDV